MRYTETTLKTWIAPLSQTEEQRVENTVKMIKDAVLSYSKLYGCTIEVFAQGSYANNTNVRHDSDVDICVMCKSTFFPNYVDGMIDKDYGHSEGSISYADYKKYVIDALKLKFGSSAVTVGNKSIKIKENSYHVNADVVPAFQYRDYKIISSKAENKFVEGIKYIATDGTVVINYPKIHIDNGKQKNNQTNMRYKRLVRIMKRIKNNMQEEGKVDSTKITSFLIECLVWNVPNSTINSAITWENMVRDAIAYLWNAIKEERHKEWGEVSEKLYLFHSSRKWTAKETQDFLYDMYNYLQY